MQTYKRNPMIKIISLIFLSAHAILGLRMISTDNVILGTATITTGLFWVYYFINEFSPYLRMDDKKLLLYRSLFVKPKEFKLDKNVMMYYHSKERLVFTYLNSSGVREKAKIFLGYMSPEISAVFVRDFRSTLAKFQVDEEEVIKKAAKIKVAKKGKGRPKKAKADAETAVV